MLKPETQRLWDALSGLQAMHGFVLIGGTALAMRIQHRVSEDLDFAWPHVKLPRSRIAALQRLLHERGLDMVANDSPHALEEFAEAGMDLLDYQQNFVVDQAVKLTFVAPDREVAVQLDAADPHGLRVASMEEVFRLKCIACANRSKTRDWFDMYRLFESGLFRPVDMIEPFERAGAPQKIDIALARMCSARPDLGDEGYAHLVGDGPSLQDMKDRFVAVRDEIERELAGKAITRAAMRRGDGV